MKKKIVTGSIFDAQNATLIVSIYAVVGVIILMYLSDWIACVIAGVSIVIIIIAHLYLATQTQERRFWGNLAQPFSVVDWGPLGEDFERDLLRKYPHLVDQFVAVPASEVEDVLYQIIENLIDSENELYLDGEIKLHHFYFAYGERANEGAKEYRKFIGDSMSAIREQYHTRAAAPENSHDPDWYKETFIKSHMNGSAMQDYQE